MAMISGWSEPLTVTTKGSVSSVLEKVSVSKVRAETVSSMLRDSRLRLTTRCMSSSVTPSGAETMKMEANWPFRMVWLSSSMLHFSLDRALEMA